jgi:hypothetical protein
MLTAKRLINASNFLMRSQLHLHHVPSPWPCVMNQAEFDKALEAAPDDEYKSPNSTTFRVSIHPLNVLTVYV